MKNTYKLKIESFEEKKKAILKRGIITSIIAVAGGIIISTINAGFNWKVLILMIPIAGISIYFGLRRALKIQQEAWESYEIQWDKKIIKKSQIRTKDVLIQKDEITKIVEHKEGVTIKTNNTSNIIYIPKELENFNILINELKSQKEQI